MPSVAEQVAEILKREIEKLPPAEPKVETGPPKPKKKFQLLHGAAIVEVPRKDGSGLIDEILYQTDELKGVYPVIESEVDLAKRMNKPGFEPKFREIHESPTAVGHTWDPSKETIEQFAMRMKGIPATPQVPIVSQPPVPDDQLPHGWTKEEFMQFCASEELDPASALKEISKEPKARSTLDIE